MKCPYCKEGDPKYGHDFKNKLMLQTHIKHHHSEIVDKPEPVPEPKAEPIDKDPSLEDIGLTDPKAEPETFYCSECGAENEGNSKNCVNCGASFEDGSSD